MQPRTYLFVPGNRPERFAKAFTSGADAICENLAKNVNLGGVYKAWISDDTGSPSTRAHSNLNAMVWRGRPLSSSWKKLVRVAASIRLMKRRRSGAKAPSTGARRVLAFLRETATRAPEASMKSLPLAK